MKTKLHYSEIISITDGRLVAFNGMEGVYNVCNAVVGPGVTTLAILYLNTRVKNVILETYPTLDSPEITKAVDKVLEEWEEKGKGESLLNTLMDKYVLPLMPSKHLELTHLSDDDVERVGEGYGEFLEDKLKGKKVIIAQI